MEKGFDVVNVMEGNSRVPSSVNLKKARRPRTLHQGTQIVKLYRSGLYTGGNGLIDWQRRNNKWRRKEKEERLGTGRDKRKGLKYPSKKKKRGATLLISR